MLEEAAPGRRRLEATQRGFYGESCDARSGWTSDDLLIPHSKPRNTHLSIPCGRASLWLGKRAVEGKEVRESLNRMTYDLRRLRARLDLQKGLRSSSAPC